MAERHRHAHVTRIARNGLRAPCTKKKSLAETVLCRPRFRATRVPLLVQRGLFVVRKHDQCPGLRLHETDCVRVCELYVICMYRGQCMRRAGDRSEVWILTAAGAVDSCCIATDDAERCPVAIRTGQQIQISNLTRRLKSVYHYQRLA